MLSSPALFLLFSLGEVPNCDSGNLGGWWFEMAAVGFEDDTIFLLLSPEVPTPPLSSLAPTDSDGALYLPYKTLVSTVSSMVFSEGEAQQLIEILTEKAGIVQDTWHTVGLWAASGGAREGKASRFQAGWP